VKAAETDLLVIGADVGAARAGVRIEARAGAGPWTALGPPRELSAPERSTAGWLMPLAWPANFGMADQLRLTFELAEDAAPLRVRHLALYPRAGGIRRAR